MLTARMYEKEKKYEKEMIINQGASWLDLHIWNDNCKTVVGQGSVLRIIR